VTTTYVDPGGEFTRDSRYLATRITRDGRDGDPVEPGRYRLVVSRLLSARSVSSRTTVSGSWPCFGVGRQPSSASGAALMNSRYGSVSPAVIGRPERGGAAGDVQVAQPP